ncbi:adenosine deaminase [Galendromus occidentalis]|uniref:adenosine deaminase n=1 Tax=Galendromus occidentalis TaxID=34638 RepID=A0AAJ7P9D4_9ACAR|nr:adenosine deaminase [Galendromus occidentalis]
MSFIREADDSKRPLSRVELHLHLDGSIRYSTIWEYATKRKADIGVKSADGVRRWLQKTTSTTLADFLKDFRTVSALFADDPEAWTRIAYELCEDQARDGVAYFEVRHGPQLLLSASSRYSGSDVVQAVQKGLDEGKQQFGVNSRQILTCVLENDDWAREIVQLCQKYRDIVGGIDIAKNETIHAGFTKTEIEVYHLAEREGINRTAHAGESGPWNSVQAVMDTLHCTRVGHGYRVFEDPSGNCYNQARKQNLHFEVCPISSVLTGGCPPWASKHAVVHFAEDNANFSISKDDTTITGSTLDDEYKFLQSLGLTEAHIVRANFNAARSCFLPVQEKKELIHHLQRTYGIQSGD